MVRREWEKNSQAFPYASNPSLLQTLRNTMTTQTKMKDVKPAPPWTLNDATMPSSSGSPESALYQDLEHIRFGFDNVWPKEFLDEIKSHCPLDVQAMKEAKTHFVRP